MDGLIKQLFTPNYPLAQLSEHKTEYLRRPAGVSSNLGSFAKKNCLNFHKINRCHYLLEAVVVILLFRYGTVSINGQISCF